MSVPACLLSHDKHILLQCSPLKLHTTPTDTMYAKCAHDHAVGTDMLEKVHFLLVRARTLVHMLKYAVVYTRIYKRYSSACDSSPGKSIRDDASMSSSVLHACSACLLCAWCLSATVFFIFRLALRCFVYETRHSKASCDRAVCL